MLFLSENIYFRFCRNSCVIFIRKKIFFFRFFSDKNLPENLELRVFLSDKTIDFVLFFGGGGVNRGKSGFVPETPLYIYLLLLLLLFSTAATAAATSTAATAAATVQYCCYFYCCYCYFYYCYCSALLLLLLFSTAAAATT